MKLPAYPRYKASGVEWLGDVPEHWEVKRLKNAARINDEALPETTLPDFEFEYVDIGGVSAVDGITATEQVVFENAPSRARRMVRHGDTIVSTVRTYLRAIAPIKDPPQNLIVSTGFAVVRPRSVDSEFLAYALRESSFVESVVSRSVGVSYPAVNAAEVGGISIPLPGPAEQQAIAAFLDREMGRIDTLVAKKRELIERLKEKRTALISRTVTRGLPPAAARAAVLPENPHLKPSGLEWLGDIPEHWEVVQARRVSFVFVPQRNKPELNTEGDGFPWITVEDLTADTVWRSSKDLFVSSEAARATGSRAAPAGSILAACVGTFGISSITKREVVINQQIQAYVPVRIYPPFLNTVIRVSAPYFEQMATMATISYVNAGRFGSLPIPLPPLTEQVAIVTYLDAGTAKLDALVGKVEEAVERLQEYRTALITAAVTGKIDVRKEVAA